MPKETQGFCWNSRRWIALMDLRMKYPEACLSKGQGCDNCAYFENRTATPYIKSILLALKDASQEAVTRRSHAAARRDSQKGS